MNHNVSNNSLLSKPDNKPNEDQQTANTVNIVNTVNTVDDESADVDIETVDEEEADVDIETVDEEEDYVGSDNEDDEEYNNDLSDDINNQDDDNKQKKKGNTKDQLIILKGYNTQLANIEKWVTRPPTLIYRQPLPDIYSKFEAHRLNTIINTEMQNMVEYANQAKTIYQDYFNYVRTQINGEELPIITLEKTEIEIKYVQIMSAIQELINKLHKNRISKREITQIPSTIYRKHDYRDD